MRSFTFSLAEKPCRRQDYENGNNGDPRMNVNVAG